MFDCGNLIRFGIRHRASQTLFLSDLYNPCTSTSPTYTRLWTALHLAMIDDALQRVDVLLRRKDRPKIVPPPVDRVLRSKRRALDALPEPSPKKVAFNVSLWGLY